MSRPMRLTLNPTALDRNGLSLTQTITAASLSPILNGTLASGYDLDAVCLAQTTAGAADLLLNGVQAGGVGWLRETEERLVFTSASSNVGITYTIIGLDKGGNRLREVLTGSAASQKVFSANSYHEVISIRASGAVTGNVTVGLNGVATFTTPQHITVFTTSDETAATITVTGTDRTGRVQTEAITGPGVSATVVGVMNFATVTHVVTTLAATGFEIGVDGLCESAWLPMDYNIRNFNAGLGVDISSGAVLTYTVQHTFDDVYSSTFVESTAVTHNHDNMVAQTVSSDGNYTNPPTATRVDLTAYTSGSLNYNVIQSGGV